MTNFSRQNFAFTIGSDPANESSGVETVDFKVSTNGQVEVYNSFVVSGTINAGGLSTNGNVVALGPVKLSVVDATLTVKAVAPKMEKAVRDGAAAAPKAEAAAAEVTALRAQLVEAQAAKTAAQSEVAATQALLDDAYVSIDEWLAEEVQDAFAAQETSAFISGVHPLALLV